MLPVNLSLSIVDQVEAPRWILFSICVIGVVLAYVTDDGLLVGDEALHLPGFRPLAARGAEKQLIDGSGGGGGKVLFETGDDEGALAAKIVEWFFFFTLVSPLKTFLQFSFELSAFVAKGKIVWGRWCEKLKQYRMGFRLKRLATTKRHFFYLLEKEVLGVPIVKGETEIDSYLDCKTSLGKDWPFMWQVGRVKGDTVVCEGYSCTPMSSYSYLDLVRDNRVQRAAIKAAEEWSTGNHGPRMLGGNMTILMDLEKVISKFFGRDDTLLCATGYLACMSACAAVCSEKSIVFADMRAHASLRAGLKLSDAKCLFFKHNKFTQCEALIRKHRHKHTDAWMVVESVYSMDGDLVDLPAAHALCKKYNIKLLIDEAHGLGVVGKTGRGVEEHFNMKGCADVIVGTFSKSIASIGGYISGPAKLISYLDFHAQGNVFSAPLPAYSAAAAIKSFELIDSEPEIIEKAQSNSRKLRAALESGLGLWPASYPDSHKYEVEGDIATTVLPVVFPFDIDRVMRVATTLKKSGYMTSAAAYPACPLIRPRLRITATASYDDSVIKGFVAALVAACIQHPPSPLALQNFEKRH